MIITTQKINICNDLNNIKKKIEDKEEIFLDEKVLCIRLEPKLEAKSYVPDSLMISEDMQIIGGRKYAFVDENGEKKMQNCILSRQKMQE